MSGDMRRVLLLGFAGALAAIGLTAGVGGSSSAPAAELSGAPLEPAAVAVAPVEAPPPPPAHPLLDLDHAERVGDHFEAPIGGGRRATLTLDPDLQAEAEKLLAEARAPKAAIVAVAPDGRILALAGRRTDDALGKGPGIADAALATEAWAPAASVFKLVTASALVAAGVDPDAKVCFHGGIRSVSESNLRDDKRDNNCQSLAFGVAHSNNAIVGKLAFEHLEPAGLADEARALFAPLPASLAMPATFGELDLPTTHELAFAQAAAGFSGSKLSALGGALLAATFAGDGAQPTPRLVDAIDGTAEPASAEPHRALDDKTARAVAKMMVATCEIGSASRAFGKHRKVSVAGKTGTLTRTEGFEMEHSWFVGYAPADHPQIVVAVILGNPENWHLRAPEAARRLIDRALGRATRRADPHSPATHD